jgi:hypothetical protein
VQPRQQQIGAKERRELNRLLRGLSGCRPGVDGPGFARTNCGVVGPDTSSSSALQVESAVMTDRGNLANGEACGVGGLWLHDIADIRPHVSERRSSFLVVHRQDPGIHQLNVP